MKLIGSVPKAAQLKKLGLMLNVESVQIISRITVQKGEL